MSETGFARWNCWQPSLVKDTLRSFARKASRLSAVAVTGDWPVASSFWLAARNGVWMSTRFWQYIAGLLDLSVAALTGAWPSSLRYWSVFAGSDSSPSITTWSFSGTSAALFGGYAAAAISSSASERVGTLASDWSGTSYGAHPRIGSTYWSSTAFALLTWSSVDPST